MAFCGATLSIVNQCGQVALERVDKWTGDGEVRRQVHFVRKNRMIRSERRRRRRRRRTSHESDDEGIQHQ